ncbi:MAG: T9SS type A sorting domain-containing protein [Chlorobi bacterium]|nr:T9SS type A sorting domain-containing protein [Chlorobiota bacterium]MCI0715777.1 T9SS type A sorting domain-containing protein [Chlorobiota bacterium]
MKLNHKIQTLFRLHAGCILTSLIAVFTVLACLPVLNSQTWAPIGPGFTNGFVSCVVVYNGELVAGGSFTLAGFTSVNRIAKWNGSSWSALGSGLNDFAQTMELFNGNLWVGGNFTTAGNQSAPYVCRWNGSAWLPLPTSPSAGVYDFQIYGGELVICGNFEYIGVSQVRYIAKWNGSSWSTLGSGMNQAGVYALTIYNGELIAGGNFTSAGGVSASNIARWNGSSWAPLGLGVSGGFLPVLALGVYNGELYAGGDFTSAEGVSANRVARWNGSSWAPCNSGVNATVLAFYVRNNELVVGGNFTLAGGQTVNRIARWDGGVNWYPASSGGMNGPVRAFVTYNAELVVGGLFTNAGGTTALNIARTDDPLPVVLSRFSASVIKNNVKLEWETVEEINNRGFDIERKSLYINWIKTGFVQGNGTTNEPRIYGFTDNYLQRGTYRYRLKQIDYNGNFEYHELENDVNIAAPADFYVSQNYPNPSNPGSKIDYQLPENGRVAIKLYDVTGRELKILVDEIKEAGFYSFEFDGSAFASGVYYYRIISGSYSATKKMVLIK